jgi:hypothetical protein
MGTHSLADKGSGSPGRSCRFHCLLTIRQFLPPGSRSVRPNGPSVSEEDPIGLSVIPVHPRPVPGPSFLPSHFFRASRSADHFSTPSNCLRAGRYLSCTHRGTRTNRSGCWCERWRGSWRGSSATRCAGWLPVVGLGFPSPTPPPLADCGRPRCSTRGGNGGSARRRAGRQTRSGTCRKGIWVSMCEPKRLRALFGSTSVGLGVR